MAAFATMAAAEVRAVAKVSDKTWVQAHVARTVAGVIAVRVQRFMSAANPGNGGWVEITDDAVV